MLHLTKKVRRVLPLLAGMFLAGAVLGGCGGTYKPLMDGQCNKGRTWVPPQQDENGEWKAGHCKWENQ